MTDKTLQGIKDHFFPDTKLQ